MSLPQIQKADEAAALRAKLLNQESGPTPRTRRGKVMSQVQLRNISSRIPVIPFAPIPIPVASSTTREDSSIGTPIISGPTVPANFNIAQLAAELVKHGATVTLGAKSPTTTKKRRAGATLTASHQVPHEVELDWKASLFWHVVFDCSSSFFTENIEED